MTLVCVCVLVLAPHQTMPDVDVPFTARACLWTHCASTSPPNPLAAEHASVVPAFIRRMLLSDPAAIEFPTDLARAAHSPAGSRVSAASEGEGDGDGAAAADDRDGGGDDRHASDAPAPAALSVAGATALRGVFDQFDADRDGVWRGDEYTRAAAALPGVVPAAAAGGDDDDDDDAAGLSFLAFCSFAVAALATPDDADGQADAGVRALWSAVHAAGFDAWLTRHRHATVQEAVASQDPDLWPRGLDELLVREIDRVEASVASSSTVTASQVVIARPGPLLAVPPAALRLRVCVLRRLNGLVAQAVPLVDLDQTHTPWSMAHLLQRCRYLLLRSTTQQLFNHVVECTADNTQPPAINVRGVVLCCDAWCFVVLCLGVLCCAVVLFVPAYG